MSFVSVFSEYLRSRFANMYACARWLELQRRQQQYPPQYPPQRPPQYGAQPGPAPPGTTYTRATGQYPAGGGAGGFAVMRESVPPPGADPK